MKKLIMLVSVILICFVSTNYSSFANNPDTIKIDKKEVHKTVEYTEKIAEDIQSGHSEEEHEEHGGMEPLLFIIIAILIGAATRHFFRKLPIPFTVLLLIIGIGLGLLNRFGLYEGWGDSFGIALKWAGHIDPHAILFIFLPILIFEAAFAMDLHTFKKTATNAIILAVPGIIVALVLSAGLAMLLKYFNIGLYSWEWTVALMFGSVISATDPVAVVALLKELGASKKLGTLIEGESMLNDGTAIVLFMVFFTAITGATADNHAVVEFGRVAFGGILIGIIIAATAIAWVKRVFNDALVEISVIVGSAYISFFIAEHFMHVSGVLALVALGLAMAGVGKTRISPEVEHFLHEFWELASFFANTLIFIIVGVVISQRTEFTASDFIILAIVYVGLHIVRFIMLIIFYPLMRKIGYGINMKETVVLWYGALRGAIALALALVVVNVDDKFISPEIKNQFFFITAGVVTLTLLINATTIKYVLNALGLTKIAPAKALMILQANQYLRTSAENHIEKIKTNRFLSSSNWSEVKKYLPKEVEIGEEYKDIQIDTISEMRKRVLEKEKSSYWHQFKDGMLSASSVRKLSDQIDEIMDSGGLVSLSKRKDLELLLKTPKLLSTMQNWPIMKSITRNRFIERLSVSYEIARGFVNAQDEAIKLVESMYRSLDPNDKEGNENLSLIENEINENKIEGLTFIRNIRKTYPEIYDAISTRHAIRSLLNYELKTVERLHKNGRIDSGEAEKMIHIIEHKMKKLLNNPPKVKVPDAADLINEISWLKDLDNATHIKLGEVFQSRIFSIGEKIIREDNNDNSVYIIARGTAKISIKNEDIDIIGAGNIVGEIGFLLNKPRMATVEAESPVTAMVINSTHLKQLIEESQEFEQQLWKFAGMRITKNLLSNKEPYNIWRPKVFEKWLKSGIVEFIKEDIEYDCTNKICLILKESEDKGNTDFKIISGEKIKLLKGAVIYVIEENN
ncbi:MAG: hypothetical protein Kow0068_08710 [Marinilabiliales bacterium]